LSTFYAAMLPRMDEILPYLAQISPDDIETDVRLLFHLTLALAEIAPAVENHGQASVVDGYDVARFIAVHE
jgi:hypothetical protein